MSKSTPFGPLPPPLVPLIPGGPPRFDANKPRVVIAEPDFDRATPAPLPAPAPTPAPATSPGPPDDDPPLPSAVGLLLGHLRAALAAAWRALRLRLHPERAGNPRRSAAVAMRLVRATFPDGPPVDHVLVVKVPPSVSVAVTDRTLRDRLARSVEWRGVRPVVEQHETDSPLVSVELVPVAPRQFNARVVFPGAEQVVNERIHAGRRSLRVGRGRQRQDRKLNHVAFEDALTWMPRTLADIDLSSVECAPVLEVSPTSAPAIVVTLRRGDDRSVVEAGECVVLEDGDLVLFSSTQGDHNFAIQLKEITQ